MTTTKEEHSSECWTFDPKYPVNMNCKIYLLKLYDLILSWFSCGEIDMTIPLFAWFIRIRKKLKEMSKRKKKKEMGKLDFLNIWFLGTMTLAIGKFLIWKLGTSSFYCTFHLEWDKSAFLRSLLVGSLNWVSSSFLWKLLIFERALEYFGQATWAWMMFGHVPYS